MADRPLIFSTHTLHPDISGQLERLGILRIASKPDSAAIATESAGANYIVVRANIDSKIVLREKGLRALVRHGAGLDMIPVDICTRAGVLVANVPGANAVTVAEHVIWSALAILRKYPLVNADLRIGGWEQGRAHSNDGLELTEQTIGIIGMGNIGRAISRIASNGFSMRVLTTTRSPETVPDGVLPKLLFELLEQSDIVVLCCPLNGQTRDLIGRAELAKMKKDAVLVNVSRGPVVNELALVSALESGKLRGAVLDVFNEQPLPKDHPLFAMGNVILTPHMAGITTESMLRMGQGVVDEITRLIKGEVPLNFINPEALEFYQKRFAR